MEKILAMVTMHLETFKCDHLIGSPKSSQPKISTTCDPMIGLFPDQHPFLSKQVLKATQEAWLRIISTAHLGSSFLSRRTAIHLLPDLTRLR